jgi:hypothetical protein
VWSKIDLVGMTWRGKRVDSYLVVPGTLVSPLAPDTVRLMEENDLPGNTSNPHWKWMGVREVGVVLDHVCRETPFKRLDVYVKILLSGSRVRWVGEWNMKCVSEPPRVVREIGSHKHFRGF